LTVKYCCIIVLIVWVLPKYRMLVNCNIFIDFGEQPPTKSSEILKPRSRLRTVSIIVTDIQINNYIALVIIVSTIGIRYVIRRTEFVNYSNSNIFFRSSAVFSTSALFSFKPFSYHRPRSRNIINY